MASAGSTLPFTIAMMRRPFRSPWVLHADSIAARSAEGAFALNYIEIADLYVYAYYTLRWSTPGAPVAEVRHTIRRAQSPSTSTFGVEPAFYAPVTPASVQSFGRLEGHEVGVIDMPILNQPGQRVALLVTPPGQGAPTWMLDFLEQVGVEHYEHSKTGLSGDSTAIPDVQIVFMLGFPGNRHSGYFAIKQPTYPTSYLPSVFFVSDRDGHVSQLSEVEFALGTTGSREPMKPYVSGGTGARRSHVRGFGPDDKQEPNPPAT